MDLLFKLNGVELSASEAKSLLQATKQESAFVIDLERHVDAKILSAPNLFALSIEKRDPSLAALASKVAFSSQQKSAPRKTLMSATKPPVLRLIKKGDLIQECVEKPSYKTVGAAMILGFAGTEDFTALREVACHWVNDHWKDQRFPEKSQLFRGFKNDGLISGRLIPMENERGVDRSDTYYVSPCYLSVTAGLKMLQDYGFVTTEVRWSVGSRKAEPDQRANSTRRKYYVFKLTEAGKQVKEQWGDLEKFVSKFWRNRVSQKTA